MLNLQTAKDVIDFIEKEEVKVIDLRFMDFPGLWQHFSVPAREVDESTFEGGLGFDGQFSFPKAVVKLSFFILHIRQDEVCCFAGNLGIGFFLQYTCCQGKGRYHQAIPVCQDFVIAQWMNPLFANREKLLADTFPFMLKFVLG